MGPDVVMTYDQKETSAFQYPVTCTLHSTSLVCVDWNIYLTSCTGTTVTIKIFPFLVLMSSAVAKRLKALNNTAGKKANAEYKNKLVNEIVS